jgi:hypothetical protein
MNRTPDILAGLRAEILAVPPAELPSIIGQIEAVKAEALALLVMSARQSTIEPDLTDADYDRLVDVQEAARMLGQTPRCVRDHQKELPRADLPGRTVRFSKKRLSAFVKRRSYL